MVADYTIKHGQPRNTTLYCLRSNAHVDRSIVAGALCSDVLKRLVLSSCTIGAAGARLAGN